jgi:hypothetical protein
MQRYATPLEIARVLARHAPRHISSILDPAVGEGGLLRPLVGRLAGESARIVCVDLDQQSLIEVAGSVGAGLESRCDLVNADFLAWSSTRSGKTHRPRFDCIVMNPPFSARRSASVAFDVGRELGHEWSGNRRLPIETAFILRAVVLLRPKGRLLAVVPGSVITASSTGWLRKCLQSLGAIHYVRELPRRTFAGVESRFYLLVFEKGAEKHGTWLCNHDVDGRRRLRISGAECAPDGRLDYAYHFARRLHRRLIETLAHDWVRLGELVTILRGWQPSPADRGEAVHTWDYSNGFWRTSSRHRQSRRWLSYPAIEPGDVLVKRVGRACSRTFGRCVGLLGMPCTDCVLLLRPADRRDSTRLLFAIRSLAGMQWASALLERGTGAAYIGHDSLADVVIPSDLSDRYPTLFTHYVDAVSARAFPVMERIESQVRGYMRRAHADLKSQAR